jgi:non-heme chloroperoxidase
MINNEKQFWSFTKLVCYLLCSILVTSLYAQQANAWHDPSPHIIKFITVEKNVQLEILDWGGHGKSIILLAGGGNTAHVFDDFAPKLAVNFHVYGITRRGFGSSGYSAIDNVDWLGRDILLVIDSLKIIKPVLAGHSIGGAELSSVARISPDRISALIYLEAAYPYAFSNAETPKMKEFMEISGPQAPSPGEKDLMSFNALQKWDSKTYGFQMPESEFRQTWDSASNGRPTHPRDFPGFTIFSIIVNDSTKHTGITVPCLTIFAIPHIPDAWMLNSINPKVRTDAEIYFTKIDSLVTRQVNAFKESIPDSKLIKLRGMHYIYISNESEVLNAICRFMSGLK